MLEEPNVVSSIIESNEQISDNALEVNTNAEISNDSDDINNTTKVPNPNCLALTVRRDYNLTIVKNIFTASGRLSWKVVLATLVLNFLNLIF